MHFYNVFNSHSEKLMRVLKMTLYFTSVKLAGQLDNRKLFSNMRK